MYIYYNIRHRACAYGVLGLWPLGHYTPTSPTSRTSYSLRDLKSAAGRGPPTRTPPGPPKTSPEPLQNLLQPSQTSLEPPQSLLEAPKALWTLLQRTLWRPDARARGDRPASKLVPGEFWQHNHHKIITKSLRILLETLPKPPATFPDISGSATELPGAFQEFFWTRTLDSGHWTPDFGLPTLDSILKHTPYKK